MGRKRGHGGHHGGAWKVAYADFVTAMMALFIVLWILGSSAETRAAVATYFQHASIVNLGSGSGFLTDEGVNILHEKLKRIREESILDSIAAVEAAIDELQGQSVINNKQVADRGVLEESARELESLLGGDGGLRELSGQVRIEFTSQGLRIQLQDLSEHPLFAVGSAEPTDNAREVLTAVARILKPLPNFILVEGHTDSRPFAGTRGYTNWELSGDRANAARRVLEDAGLDPSRIARVVGYADRRLLVPDRPFSEHNRRISITVAYNNARID